MGQMNLSARWYHRVLKLARTIADLAGSENIQAAHLVALEACIAKIHDQQDDGCQVIPNAVLCQGTAFVQSVGRK